MEVKKDYSTKTKNLKLQYEEIVGNITTCQYPDKKFYREIFYDLWNQYYQDKITVEEFASQLDQKAAIYLQETY